MANVEIGEINSSSSQGCTSSSSVIKVGYKLTMNEKDIVDLSSARVFRVPRPLREANDSLFSPQLVSIGPFHYRKKVLKEMEKSKSEAVRRMQIRIQQKDPQACIESIVEQRIVPKVNKIREFYGEDIPFESEELAWMVTRDACFLFEFIVNYIDRIIGSEDLYKEEVSEFSWKNNSFFDFNFVNPMRERIMEDILLLENQIPLWVLEDLLEFKMGSTEGAKAKLEVLMNSLLCGSSRHSVFKTNWNYSFDSSCHVLHVVYEGMVGFAGFYGTPGALAMLESAGLPPLPRNRIQLLFKDGVDSMKAICGRWCNLSSNTNPGETVNPRGMKLPSAVELTRQGVKLSPVFMSLPWLRFDEKTSTLYLPQIEVTPESCLLMRSVIAMEVTIKDRYIPTPMTVFGMFMDELIDNEEDVAVLRKAEVINNFLGSNQLVADHFNSLARGIPVYVGCQVIDNARMGLHKYTRRKYKILWSEFVSAYFSKPWMAAGSMAAVLLLLMTVAQVFCLFFTCNPKSP